jgi:hypothetical protein
MRTKDKIVFDDPSDIHIEEENNDKKIVHVEKIWIADIYDGVSILVTQYSKMDERLKWFGIVNLIKGPLLSIPIKHDEYINKFINDFLDMLDNISKDVSKNKLEVRDDEKNEYNRIMSLNRPTIYSRISHCINKRYISK